MKPLIRFLIIFLITFMNCGPSLPLLDANIDNYKKFKIHINEQVGLVNDVFENNPSVKGNPVYPVPANIALPSSHGVPLSIHFTKQFKQRFEIGFGLVGIYEKLVLLKPANYDSFNIKNIIISQVFHVGAGIMGDHTYGGATMDAGFLFGIPLLPDKSLTTGIIWEYAEHASLTEAQFTEFETWGATLDVERQSIVVPITFSKKLKKGNLLISLKVPFDYSEQYSLHESYTDSSEAGTRYNSINLNHINFPNIALVLGFSWR
jgi:hypothetical protein